ncbi:MAG: hypothetical protein ACPG49_09045 [Chitinophagales bacterium]
MSLPTFDQFEPTFVALSADLPKGIVLSEQKVLGFIDVKLKTSALTTLSLSLTTEGLQIHFSPSISIQVLNAIQVKWDRVYYDFRQAKISAVEVSNNFWGKIIGNSLRNQLTGITEKLFKNTPLKKRNYNPIADKSLQRTLQTLQQNAQNLSKTLGGQIGNSSFDLKKMRNVELGLSFLTKEKIQFATTQGAIVIPKSGKVAISVQLKGNVEDLMIPAKRKIKQIQFYSAEDIFLYSVDKEAELQKALAVMQLIEIKPKGEVSLLQWLPLGIIQKADNVESALKLLRVVLLLENIPPEALRKLMSNPLPTESHLVKGITKITIDDALTDAFIATLKENCEPMEGINLCDLLNLE